MFNTQALLTAGLLATVFTGTAWGKAEAVLYGSSDCSGADRSGTIGMSTGVCHSTSFTYCPPDSGCTTGDALSIDFYTDGVHEDYSFYSDASCNDLFGSISSACLELPDGGIGSFKKTEALIRLRLIKALS
ncbi:hypothetical protein K438DRAFT_2168980 [Mycena galopus ATCC 62051]|nr:hypothetical protein K438DRAFT_2168980 [Mycena galopus ATCC 62051]